MAVEVEGFDLGVGLRLSFLPRNLESGLGVGVWGFGPTTTTPLDAMDDMFVERESSAWFLGVF